MKDKALVLLFYHVLSLAATDARYLTPDIQNTMPESKLLIRDESSFTMLPDDFAPFYHARPCLLTGANTQHQ